MLYISPLARPLGLLRSPAILAGLFSAFLVVVPVFFQAPLVRIAPWLSLSLGVGWLALSRTMLERDDRAWQSGLMWGFGLTWLCGTVYWGWLRHEPLWHVPMEALALPWAWWGVTQASAAYRIGGAFYLGSLLGTAATDLYFWLAGLFPYWRALIEAEGEAGQTAAILQAALGQVGSPVGVAWAIAIGLGLALVTVQANRKFQVQRWAFGCAVGSTLIVDGLFALLASWS